jgi:hypothetical protein
VCRRSGWDCAAIWKVRGVEIALGAEQSGLLAAEGGCWLAKKTPLTGAETLCVNAQSWAVTQRFASLGNAKLGSTKHGFR